MAHVFVVFNGKKKPGMRTVSKQNHHNRNSTSKKFLVHNSFTTKTAQNVFY